MGGANTNSSDTSLFRNISVFTISRFFLLKFWRQAQRPGCCWGWLALLWISRRMKKGPIYLDTLDRKERSFENTQGGCLIHQSWNHFFVGLIAAYIGRPGGASPACSAFADSSIKDITKSTLDENTLPLYRTANRTKTLYVCCYIVGPQSSPPRSPIAQLKVHCFQPHYYHQGDPLPIQGDHQRHHRKTSYVTTDAQRPPQHHQKGPTAISPCLEQWPPDRNYWLDSQHTRDSRVVVVRSDVSNMPEAEALVMTSNRERKN
ncbi:hypothetical protein V1477_002394 [Vespula maculifrons]|uniref:Uncharacterized protein n=1 Tax=Vespula maculifrons TaxID=7453 RepID=A0ABD2CWD2_VESMC